MIFREVEDRDLVAKAAKGSVDAYNLLVSRWEKRVFNYILRLVRNREDALDLSQDVFLKAYQNLGKLDDASRFAPWLYRIAHNESFSLLRRKRPDGEELLPDDEAAVPARPGSRSSGVAMLPVETSIAVARAMERLNDEQREAVVLKIYEGFKFEEMAEVLGCPVSTVKSRLYTALDLLKDILAPADLGKTDLGRAARGNL